MLCYGGAYLCMYVCMYAYVCGYAMCMWQDIHRDYKSLGTSERRSCSEASVLCYGGAYLCMYVCMYVCIHMCVDTLCVCGKTYIATTNLLIPQTEDHAVRLACMCTYVSLGTSERWRGFDSGMYLRVCVYVCVYVFV